MTTLTLPNFKPSA